MTLKCETHMLQDPSEFKQFLQLIEENSVRSFLEIGSKNGGTFWRISHVLPKGSRVVSVDLPHGDTSFKETEPNLVACVDELTNRGYDAFLFLGDSTDPNIVKQVEELGPYDLVFIDANHTEPYVWKDWQNYGPMGSMVAFHDIGHIQLPHKPTKKMPIEVAKVWNEIKKDYHHTEIKKCVASNGIGILWRSRPVSMN